MSERFAAVYAEINNYQGDFGDPIVGLIDDPFPELLAFSGESTILEGLGVCLLCWLASAIDNSTYEAALSSFRARVEKVVGNGVLAAFPDIERSAHGFLISEEEFFEGCRGVYESRILHAEI